MLKSASRRLTSNGRSRDLDPVAGMYFVRGKQMEAQGKLEYALGWYKQSLTAFPYFQTFVQLGNVLTTMGRLAEALSAYDQAIALSSREAIPHANRGNVLVKLRRHQEAILAYDKAIALWPGTPEYYFYRATARLALGDFTGFKDMGRYRDLLMEKFSAQGAAALETSIWTGAEPLLGKTILLHDATDGYGDTLQFCRYVQRLLDLGARVVAEVHSAIINLVRTVAGPEVLVFTVKTLRPAFDYQASMITLPCLLESSVDTIYSPKGYIRADASMIDAWHRRLGTRRVPRIGLAWWTSTPSAAGRCMALSDLVRHLPAGLEYFSLHHQVRETDERALRSSSITHFGSEMSFDQTAALMECCDRIVAIDSSLGNLAGALGRPLSLALRHSPDWRWFLDRDDSPWYPSARLYRQATHGDWSVPLAQIGADLAREFAPTH